MATAVLPDKLIGASYLFFLSNESDPMLKLKEYVGYSFIPHMTEDVFELGLSAEKHTETYMAKDAPQLRLDVEKRRHDNVISVSMANFIHSDDNPDWRRQIDFLDDCAKTLEASGIDVLGTTVVAVADANDSDEDFKTYREAVGEPLDHVSAKFSGNIIRQLLGDLNHQFFFIENFNGTDLENTITDKLPGIVWSMQRLTREMAFFEDRLITIRSEKKQIDEDLSRVFHQKVGSALNAASAQVLEEQITQLSSMYSVMATDLHLVSDAVGTFDRDLATLGERTKEFGVDDDSFPRYRLAAFKAYLKELRKNQADLRLSLDNTKAAIDIAQTQAEILRGSQGLALQEQTRELLDQNLILQDERASLQAAASVVELVVIFYYSLVAWKTVAVYGTVDLLSPLAKFSVIGIFSVAVVTLTHYVGASLHNRKVKWVPILVSGSFVLAALVVMALLPGTVADKAEH